MSEALTSNLHHMPLVLLREFNDLPIQPPGQSTEVATQAILVTIIMITVTVLTIPMVKTEVVHSSLSHPEITGTCAYLLNACQELLQLTSSRSPSQDRYRSNSSQYSPTTASPAGTTSGGDDSSAKDDEEAVRPPISHLPRARSRTSQRSDSLYLFLSFRPVELESHVVAFCCIPLNSGCTDRQSRDAQTSRTLPPYFLHSYVINKV